MTLASTRPLLPLTVGFVQACGFVCVVVRPHSCTPSRTCP